MFSESSTSVSALLPTALLPRQGRRITHKNSLLNLLYEAFCNLVVLVASFALFPSLIKTPRLFIEHLSRLFNRPATSIRRPSVPRQLSRPLSLPLSLAPSLPRSLPVNHWWRLPTVAQQSRPTDRGCRRGRRGVRRQRERRRRRRRRRRRLDDDDDSS